MFHKIIGRSVPKSRAIHIVHTFPKDAFNLLPFRSPTGKEIMKDIDLSNKTCLITGGTSGIGKEVVRCMLDKNCKVVMACRNLYAARSAGKTMENGFNLLPYKVDLASLESVKKAAKNIEENHSKIDIVILNAAVFGIPWTLTEDGFETIFQVNFLSQLYLLMKLEKNLTEKARVVFMSSNSYRKVYWTLEQRCNPTLNQLSLPKDEYSSIQAYNIAKLCGIFAMHDYAYKWANTRRSVFCTNPGSFIKTNLCQNWWPYELLYTVLKPIKKSIEQAAAFPLYCATSSELDTFNDAYIGRNFQQVELSEQAHDVQLAFRIIDLCKNLIYERTGLEEDLTPAKSEIVEDKTVEKPIEDLQQSPVFTS